MSNRRRDDRRGAPQTDQYKLWVPAERQPERDSERRRHRSSTVPAQSHDPRVFLAQSEDTRQYDTRQSSRQYKQDPQYPSAAPSTSYQPAPAQTSSRTTRYPSRSSTQPAPGYSQQAASSSAQQAAYAYPSAPQSRRAQPDVYDPRVYGHRRAQTTPTPQSSYEKVSSAEDAGRTRKTASRSAYPTAQATLNAAAAPAHWVPPPQEASVSSRKYRDRDKEKDREREKERDRERLRERDTAEAEKERYRDRYRDRSDRPRDREGAESERFRESSRTKLSDRRKESDAESIMYSEHRNASRVSLSGKEGYQPTPREPSIRSHKRTRTEEGTSSTATGRLQSTEGQTPGPAAHGLSTIQPQSAGPPQEPPKEVHPPQGEGNVPPPAPRVMPVYLPPKAKSSRSHHERQPSGAAQGGQSGSDTERHSIKHHRTERTHSGPGRERPQQDGPSNAKEDVRAKLELKYGPSQPSYQDSRQQSRTVDIPLVTPGFSASSLPPENRPFGGAVPQFVSIRAGQGPSDPQAYDMLHKSNPPLRSENLQEPDRPIVPSKSAPHARSYSSEVPRTQLEHLPLDPSRAQIPGMDLSSGPQGMSVYDTRGESVQQAQQMSRSLSYALSGSDAPSRSNNQPVPTTAYDGRTPRSVPKTSVPPQAVAGPRPLRSASYSNRPNEVPLSSSLPSAPVPEAIPMTASLPLSEPSMHRGNSSPGKGSFTGNAHSGSAYHSQNKYPDTSLGHSVPNPTNQYTASSYRTPLSVQTGQVANHPIQDAAVPISASDGRANGSPGSQRHRNVPPPSPQMGPQSSNGGTVKASWLVHTSKATAPVKTGHGQSRDQRVESTSGAAPGSHAQLREVLSNAKENTSHNTSPLSLRPASIQAPSQRSTPHLGARDVPTRSSTPQVSSASNSPLYVKVKEVEGSIKQSSPHPSPRMHGPPQISVVGATPSSMLNELPSPIHINRSMLAPAYPPPRISNQERSRKQSNPPATVHPYPSPQAPTAYNPMSHTPSQTSYHSQPPIESRSDPLHPVISASDVPPTQHAPTATSSLYLGHGQVCGPRASVRTPADYLTTQTSDHKYLSVPVTTEPYSDPSMLMPPVDVRSPRPAMEGSLSTSGQNVVSVPRAQMNSGGANVPSVIAPGPPQAHFAAPAKVSRPKVQIEEVPDEQAVYSDRLTSSPQQITPVHAAPAPSQPAHAYPPPNVDANASVPKSSLAQSTPVRSIPRSTTHEVQVPVSAHASALPPSLPTNAPASVHAQHEHQASSSYPSRTPSSAPPSQPAFTPVPQAPVQRTASYNLPPRTYARPSEPTRTATAPSGQSNATAQATHPSSNTAVLPSSTIPTPASSYVTATSAAPSIPPLSGADYARRHQTRMSVAGPTPTAAAEDASALTMKPSLPPSQFNDHQLHRESSRIHDLSSAMRPALNTQPQHVSNRPGLSTHFSQPTPSTHSASSNHHRAVSLPVSQPTSSTVPPSPRKISASVEPLANPATQLSQPSLRSAPPPNPVIQVAQPLSRSAPSVNPAVQPIQPSSRSIPSANPVIQPAQPSARSATAASFPPSARPSAPPTSRSRPVLPPLARAISNDSALMKTPSSIAPSLAHPSPTVNASTLAKAQPLTRETSTDGSKKKSGGFFGGLFRTKSGSSKVPEAIAVDPIPTSRNSAEDRRPSMNIQSAAAKTPKYKTATPTPAPVSVPAPPPASVPASLPASAPTPTPTSAPAPAPAPVSSTPSRTKPRGKIPDPIVIPPSQQARERKDSAPKIFTPFKILSMGSKRNRTVSAASLEACDGNTATNTALGSPTQSNLSQAPPLPPLVPPPLRDPMVATYEWRDKEEADRKQKKPGGIRRPGVTFDLDLEESPGETYPGTIGRQQGARLVRRNTGRGSTPRKRDA